ncbi:MAG: hypothetical protein HY575_02170 [candidate division NC10 bacterium]|nr:hypothetical protein [candidate division NC10 bacterium]
MAEETPTTFEVACPCCGARLMIDPEVRAVLSHEAPPKAQSVTDLKKAVEALKGEAGRRQTHFTQSMQAEKDKGKVLDRKFQEALRKAKDEPPTAPPARDIDLD